MNKKFKFALLLASSLSVFASYAKETPRGIEDEVFYFLFTDRFSNGDVSNDQGDPNDPRAFGGFDPTHKSFYHGGDFKGVTNRLDYLQNLGVTAIWITPVLKNVATQDIMGSPQGSYHGYWIVDFTDIDPHLGTQMDLHAFMDAAKSRGIKVFFDVVANHTADIITYSRCSKDVQADNTQRKICPFGDSNRPNAYVPSGQERVKTPALLNEISLYNNRGDIQNWDHALQVEQGDLAQLDDLDFSNPQVRRTMIESHQSLIRTFKPDGFRIDSVKHVPMEFWEEFAKAMKDTGRDVGVQFFTFAEVYTPEGPEVLSKHMKGTALDSVLDFRFKGVVNRVFGQGDKPSNLTDLFNQDIYYNTEHKNANQLMNFVSNHDYGRLGMGIARGLAHEPESVRLARFIQTQAFLILARGVPVLYYGDEQGFSSDGSYENAREDMFPSKVESYNRVDLLGTDKTTADDNFDQTHPIYKKVRDVTQLYAAHTALRRGVFQPQIVDDKSGLFVFTRRLGDDVYWIAFNNGKDAIDLTSHMPMLTVKPVYAATDTQTPNMLPGISYAIFHQISPPEATNLDRFSFGDLPRTVTSSSDINWTYVIETKSLTPDLTVKTYVSSNGKDYSLGTWDDSWPYQAYIDKSLAVDAKKIFIRAEIWQKDKLISTGRAQLEVNDRTPKQVSFNYINTPHEIDSVTALSDSGLITEYNVGGGSFTLDWQPEQKHLTLFPKQVSESGEISLFKPIHISKQQFLTFDAVWDGDKIKFELPVVKLKNNHSKAPYETEVFLRGSLNGWGLTQLQWNTSTSCYTGLIDWHGEAQWKIADKTWGSLNIGNPGGDFGLSGGGMPTNLTFWFSPDKNSQLSICIIDEQHSRYIIPHIVPAR